MTNLVSILRAEVELHHSEGKLAIMLRAAADELERFQTLFELMSGALQSGLTGAGAAIAIAAHEPGDVPVNPFAGTAQYEATPPLHPVKSGAVPVKLDGRYPGVCVICEQYADDLNSHVCNAQNRDG